MSKKDKEISSKDIAQEKEAHEEVQDALDGVEEQKELKLTPEQILECVQKAAAFDQAQERLLRLQADLENSRKRLARDKEDFLKYAKSGLIETLLPVLDNFDLAIKHAEKDHDPKHILQGVQMIQKMFEGVFKQEGLETLNAVGEKFDPHKHEAIGFEETDEKEEGIVTEVLQAGYKLYDRLLRPAKVKITKKKSN